MKKRPLFHLVSLSMLFILSILLINILISLSVVSAAEIILSKSSYQPGETLQAQITGNFISLNSGNIQIYKEGIPRESPVISDFTKQGDTYYFYAILPLQESNYSIKIIDSKYISSGELKTDTISRDFSIQKANYSYLSITPGFIIINDEKDFSVKVKSLNGNSDLSINFDSLTENVSVIQDNEKTLDFSVSGSNVTSNLKINDYEIPVFINKKSTSVITENSDLVFLPASLEAVVSADTDYFFKLVLRNLGTKNITGIVISSDLNAVISPSSIPNMNPDDSVYINISLKIPKTTDSISGKITSQYQNKISTLPVSFSITTKQNEVNLSGTSLTDSLSCFEIDKGKICLDNEKCNAQSTASSEGPCCLGECVSTRSGTSYTTIGLVIFVFLMLVLAYFYFVIKRKKTMKSTDEILEEKSERFKKRMSGEEVSGELDRV